MDTLFVVFVMVVGWVFLTQYGLYVETGVWYYLVTLLGAALSLSYLFVRDTWEFAGLLVLIGPILFVAGIASTVTFGANRELERIQVSSWKDILFGSVPEHFRKRPTERRNGILLSSLSFLFAFIVYQGGWLAIALNFAVIGVVAAIYLFWRARKRRTAGVTH